MENRPFSPKNARIGEITPDQEHRSLAMKAGFDTVLFKPVALTEIKAALASVVPVITHAGQSPKRATDRASSGAEPRLSIDEARRIRNERKSKTLTQEESEAAICDGIIRFQEEYLGWRSGRIHAHLIKDLLVVRILGVLTLAERQLGKSLSPEKGRDLIKHQASTEATARVGTPDVGIAGPRGRWREGVEHAP